MSCVERSKLEQFLCLFTDVRAGEGQTAILMFFNVFLILCAYYFVKPLREGWLAVSDVSGLLEIEELKAVSVFGQGLLLLPAVVVFGQLSSRWSRSQLIIRSTLFFMANLVAFYFWQPAGLLGGLPGLGIAFYLWVGVFGLFVVAQFWTFAVDIYNDERGRRLLPMIAIGATGGAAFGSMFVAPLVKSGQFGAGVLLLAALVPLAGSIGLTRWVDGRERSGESAGSSASKPPASDSQHAQSSQNGFAIILGSRLLFATALITLLLNWVNTNGETLLYKVIFATLTDIAAGSGIVNPGEVADFRLVETTAFYGDFYTWVNLAALVLQALVASRLLRYGGFGAMLLLLPVIALCSYSLMALMPILAVIKVMKIAENSTDYSINNTARNVLWLPMSHEMKFKCKPIIDTFIVRAGDALTLLTVFLGVRVFSFSTSDYCALNVVLVLAWLLSAIIVIREYRRMRASNFVEESS